MRNMDGVALLSTEDVDPVITRVYLLLATVQHLSPVSKRLVIVVVFSN